MVVASELREGVVVRIEGQIYKVIEVESRAGAAKMGGVVKTKLVNLRGGRIWEPHFRPQEKLEELPIERRRMEFLFAQGDRSTFIDSENFEQTEVPHRTLGPAASFLQPGMEVDIEFFEGEPISVVFADAVQARVKTTAPASHAQQDSAWKEAILENGVTIRVPLFIAPGESVRVDVRTGRYLERARSERKRSA
jgi:elongation factor P